MLNFPNSPSIDQIHESGTKQWQWNGSAWISLDLTEPSAPVFEFETGDIVESTAANVSIPSTMTTTDKLRVGTYGVQLQWNRISGKTSRTWTWQKLWIEIDYTIPQPVSVLFVGELF